MGGEIEGERRCEASEVLNVFRRQSSIITTQIIISRH